MRGKFRALTLLQFQYILVKECILLAMIVGRYLRGAMGKRVLQVLQDRRVTKGVVLTFALVVQPFFVSQSFSLQKIDELGGVQRIYEAGYIPRTYGEAFHVTEIAGPPTESPFTTEEAPEVWKQYRSVRFSTNYDSNIFGLKHDPKDDMIYVYEGRFGLEKSQKTYYVRLFYNIGYVENIENEKGNGYYHSQQTAFGYRFDRLSINVSNTISPKTRIGVDERTELGAPSAIISPVTDHAHVDFNYKFSPKTTASFLYDYGLFYTPHQLSDSGFNSQTHDFGPRVSYALTPKTTVFAEYRWRTIIYFEDQEFREWDRTFRAGISGRINPKTAYTFDAAFPVRDYKAPIDRLGGVAALRGSIFRRITPKLTGSLYGSWDNSVEDLDTTRSEGRVRTSETYGVHLNWQASPRINVFADASATFNWSEGFVSQTDPDNETLVFSRSPADDSYRWGVGLNWTPKRYLTIFMGYDYTNSNSSFSNNESEQHRAVSSAEVTF